MEDPRLQSSLQSDDREQEIEELQRELEHQRSLNIIQTGRHAAGLMQDPLIRGWIDRSRAEARRTSEALPLDAPERVSIGLRAYLQAINKLEEELRGLAEMGRMEERRAAATETEDE